MKNWLIILGLVATGCGSSALAPPNGDVAESSTADAEAAVEGQVVLRLPGMV